MKTSSKVRTRNQIMRRRSNVIPVSAVIVTKNEEQRIGRCLAALEGFGEIVVVDSNSADRTCEIAAQAGVRVENFTWNGVYPKKRQWCLDNMAFKYDWIFFIDADEAMTPELRREMADLFALGTPGCAGYFVQGAYHWCGKLLHHGLRNNKLCLIDRRKIEFPVIDDLGMPGMGEMEGHYQPVLNSAYKNERIGRLKNPLVHYACEDKEGWTRRHERYADWEVAMNKKRAWPGDVSALRSLAKRVFRAMPFRPFVAFLHSYVLKGGVLDGAAGLDFALSRASYYRMIRARS